MKKYGYVLLAAIVALLVSLGLATSADARTDARTSHQVVQGPGSGAAQAAADQPTPAGPDRVVLLSGLVLLLAGATAVTMARRNAEEVELPGQTA